MTVKEPYKFLFLTSNGTYGHIIETMKVAKKLSEEVGNSEIYIVCDGKAADKAREEGFAVIRHPLCRAFEEDYVGERTNFKGYVGGFLNDMVERISPDAVIMNFAYAFKKPFETDIPSFLIFPNDLRDRIKYYSDIVDKIFMTFPKSFWDCDENLDNVFPVGPIVYKENFDNEEIKKLKKSYSSDDLVLISFGAGEWKKDKLKKMLSSMKSYFKQRSDMKVLITGDWQLDIENSTTLGDLTPVEYLKYLKASDYAVFHGGISTLEACVLNTPFISIPVPGARGQVIRSRKLDESGCAYRIRFEELDAKKFKMTFDKLIENRSEIIENQKKIFNKLNPLQTIKDAVIEEVKNNGNKVEFDVEADISFTRNGTGAFLSGFEHDGEEYMFGVNRNFSEEFYAIFPNWVTELMPYSLKKRYSLRPRESEKFKQKIEHLSSDSTRSINSHKVRIHDFGRENEELTVARWHCGSNKEIFLLGPREKVRDVIPRVKCCQGDQNV